ncbi:MAG: hypothetical protein AAGA60_10820 [Cyanobacteria bacterium P01_E01_bin.42]
MSLPDQQDLARSLEITPSYLSAFLKGEKDVKSSVFVKLITLMPDEFQAKYVGAISKELEINTETNQDSKKKTEREDEKVEKIIKNTLNQWLSENGSILIMSKLTRMIAECITDKSDEQIREQINKYNAADREFSISWQTFQLIKEGHRRIVDKYEATTLARIVDPEQRYSIEEWLEAASISKHSSSDESNHDNFTNNNHLAQS